MAEEGCGDYHFWCGDADNKIMISKSDDKSMTLVWYVRTVVRSTPNVAGS